MTLKYNQGHWEWYEWVKLSEYYRHAKFDVIYHIYSVRKNCNIKIFGTYVESEKPMLKFCRVRKHVHCLPWMWEWVTNSWCTYNSSKWQHYRASPVGRQAGANTNHYSHRLMVFVRVTKPTTTTTKKQTNKQKHDHFCCFFSVKVAVWASHAKTYLALPIGVSDPHMY